MSLKKGATPYDRLRKAGDRLMRGVMLVCTSIAVVPLVLIIGYVLVVGGRALNTEFFSQAYLPPLTIDIGPPAAAAPIPATDSSVPGATPDPFATIDVGALASAESEPNPASSAAAAEPGLATDVVARGGVLHGIIGTLLVTGVALLLALPIGLLAGIFLAEYPTNRLATVVRFCTDVLSGAPSIIAGVVAYILLVQRFQAFSGLAGSVAITILMVPTITRTTEEMLKLVPNSLREAAQALGAPTWYSTFTVVIPSALTGIVTGVLLAFARGAGETAPLILTVLGNNTVSFNLLGPIAALPLLTYRYTESPFPSENTLAWGTAFVLMSTVLLINILVRLATRSRARTR